MTPKTQTIKAKTDKWDYIKLQNGKNTNFVRKNIFTNHISDKESYVDYIKNSYNSKPKKKKKKFL